MNKYKKGDIVLLKNGMEAKILEYDRERRYAEVLPIGVPPVLEKPAYIMRVDIVKKLK